MDMSIYGIFRLKEGGVTMKRVAILDKKQIDILDELPYPIMVRYAAIMLLLDKEGVTDAVWERWGVEEEGKEILLIPEGKERVGTEFEKLFIKTFKSKYPEFEKDLMREFANHKIGLRMTEFRLKTGLSQNQFAKKIGMSASHYSRLERGRQNISFLLLEEIAQKAGVWFDVSFETEEEKPWSQQLSKKRGTKSVPKIHKS